MSKAATGPFAVITGTIIHPGLLRLLPWLLTVGLALLGATMLAGRGRTPTRTLADGDLEPRLADDCEFATFDAVQRAKELVEAVTDMLDVDALAGPLRRQADELGEEIDGFVFTGNGPGDLAFAWSLAERARYLWDDTVIWSHRRAA